MHYYPVEDVIYHKFSMENYREDLLKEVLKRLEPKNLRVVLSSPKVYNHCNKTEEIYKIKYS